MAMVKGLVENVSTKWDKYSIQVNGAWYGTKMEWAHVQPSKGDLVEFDDGGGKYTKNLSIVTKGAGGTYGSPKPSAGGKGGYSNLGVELGHAANLAIQIALAGGTEAGSTDFYKAFAQNTRKCYAIMKGLREEFENPAETPEATEEVVVMKAATHEAGQGVVTSSDLF
jgi:hypothetical protein